MKLSDLENKKILILGLGKEGLDTFYFLKQAYPANVLGLADKKEITELPQEIQEEIKDNENLISHFGKNYLQSLDQYDIIFKNSRECR